MADMPLNLFFYFVFYWRDILILVLACMLFVLVVLHLRGPRSFPSFSSVVSEADRSFDALTTNLAPNIRARASLDATDLADRLVPVPRQRVHRPTFSTPVHDDAPPNPTFTSTSNLITQPSVCLPSLLEFWDFDPAGFFKVCENLFELLALLTRPCAIGRFFLFFRNHLLCSNAFPIFCPLQTPNTHTPHSKHEYWTGFLSHQTSAFLIYFRSTTEAN